MPCSRIAATTTGGTSPVGRVPAERDWWWPLATCSNSAWLICDRPAFCLQTNSTRATAASGKDVEQRAGLGLESTGQPVVRPDPSLANVDQTGFTQLRHVMRDRRLAQIERRREVADADRLRRALQDADHLQPRGIGECLDNLHRLLDFLHGHRHHGRAADALDPLGDCGFHHRSLAVPLTTVYGFASIPSTDINRSREGSWIRFKSPSVPSTRRPRSSYAMAEAVVTRNVVADPTRQADRSAPTSTRTRRSPTSDFPSATAWAAATQRRSRSSIPERSCWTSGVAPAWTCSSRRGGGPPAASPTALT